jgi:hypothetical protein
MGLGRHLEDVSRPHTHTHTRGRIPQEEGSARRRDLHLTPQYPQQTDNHAPEFKGLAHYYTNTTYHKPLLYNLLRCKYTFDYFLQPAFSTLKGKRILLYRVFP